MVLIYREFKNYLDEKVQLILATLNHINEKHPEITLQMIQKTLKDPDYVLMSQQNPYSELYFLRRSLSKKERYTLVVVKSLGDGLWISTAMTKNKVSGGAEIFRK